MIDSIVLKRTSVFGMQKIGKKVVPEWLFSHNLVWVKSPFVKLILYLSRIIKIDLF